MATLLDVTLATRLAPLTFGSHALATRPKATAMALLRMTMVSVLRRVLHIQETATEQTVALLLSSCRHLALFLQCKQPSRQGRDLGKELSDTFP